MGVGKGAYNIYEFFENKRPMMFPILELQNV